MKHKHHIIPRHMGGTDDSSNLIELTVEEHAEAHRLLWDQYGKKEDWIAWKSLSGIISKKEIIMELSKLGGHLGGKKSKPPIGHKSNLGRKWSDDYKQKMSDVCKGIKKTQEHKNKIGISNSKKWLIITPTNDQFEIFNLEKFCKDNNLHSSKMSLVASGIRKHHKNYKCIKLGVN